jgi:hypothetical protein
MSLVARKDARLTILLALGTFALLTAGVIIGARALGPASRSEDPGGGPVSRGGPEVGGPGARDEATDEEVAPPPTGTNPPALVKLLIPAYFYPSGEQGRDWDRLMEAASRVPIVAVANPASGPGTSPNPDYTDVVRRARAAGVTVIGYVNTGYAKRPRPEVEAEIDRWVQFYPEIGGIFLDAQPSEAGHAGYYAALRELARHKIEGALVVTNPGMVCAEEYASGSASDVAILFENRHGFDEFIPPPWTNRYPSARFAAIPYSIPTAKRMKEAVAKAVLKGIGYFYATDAASPNPWGRLPSYWAEEVEAVVRVNQRKPLE